jgi:hypothetical protein
MPQQWCRSTTTLLYKKGDALDISKWRPIALANTLYKLYTSMLTGISSTFAEACGILSISQEGFRAHRRTAWQLQMLVSALENARLLGRDVYALYIDFSSASNMVDHDKLFRIMLDLGFPARYVQVVAGIYSKATAHIASPQGHTADLDVDGGTIQGDTLSPFLFLLFFGAPAALATQWWPGVPFWLHARKAPTCQEGRKRFCG